MSHLYVYIKTAPVGNTNTIAHLIEHCVLNRDDLAIEDFYRLCDVKSETYLGYTRYDIHKKIDSEQFIKNICCPLDKNVFSRELLAFKEETKGAIFTDILKKKVEKLLHLDPHVNKKTPSRDIINAYHKKRYKKSNMLICDSAYNIIKNNLQVVKAGKWLLDIKKQSSIFINGEKNKVTVLPYTHWKSQVFLYFLEFLYDTYIEYSQRSVKGIYNFPISCMMELVKYVCIAVPQSTKISISTEFLNEAKKYFCEVALDEYARKIEIINLLYIGQLPTDKEIKGFIQSIDISVVKKIIE